MCIKHEKCIRQLNYLLGNLALSDVITILLSWPSKLLSIASSGFEKFICKFCVVGILPIQVSSFTLTVLAVERYHALLKPFRTGLRLKEDNIKQAIAVIWISSVAICWPGFFLSEWSEIYSSCIPNKVYFIIILVVLTYIPMIVFLYCYGSLIEGLYFSDTIRNENTNEDRNSEKKNFYYNRPSDCRICHWLWTNLVFTPLQFKEVKSRQP